MASPLELVSTVLKAAEIEKKKGGVAVMNSTTKWLWVYASSKTFLPNFHISNPIPMVFYYSDVLISAFKSSPGPCESF